MFRRWRRQISKTSLSWFLQTPLLPASCAATDSEPPLKPEPFRTPTSSMTPMVGIALVSVPHASSKRTMVELFCVCNSFVLRSIVGICNAHPVRVFQYVVRDRSSFRTAFRLRFNVNICHNSFPLVLVGGRMNHCAEPANKSSVTFLVENFFTALQISVRKAVCAASLATTSFSASLLAENEVVAK